MAWTPRLLGIVAERRPFLMTVKRLDRGVDVENPGLDQQRLDAKREMTPQPNRAFRLADRLEGPPDGVLADDLLHPQKLRQHGVAAQRHDMRVALVAGQHRQHRRSKDVALLWRVRAHIAQRTVGHERVEQPARLEESRRRTEAAQAASSPPHGPIQREPDRRNYRDRPLPEHPSRQPGIVHPTGEPNEVTNRASCPRECAPSTPARNLNCRF